MGKVKVVNRVDMLSFAISSEEEDTEKVNADSHSDSSSEQWRIQGGGGRAPPLPKKIIKNEDLFLYNFVVKNVLLANIYIQYSLTKYGFWSTSEVI